MSTTRRFAVLRCCNYFFPMISRPNVMPYRSTFGVSRMLYTRYSNLLYNHHGTGGTQYLSGIITASTDRKEAGGKGCIAGKSFMRPFRFKSNAVRPTNCPEISIEYSCDNVESQVKRDNFCIIQNFICKQDEIVLLKEVERHFIGVRYEYDHWDDAIHGYRETEKSKWSPEAQNILQRVRATAFRPGAHATQSQVLVHVLDLAENGYIKAHVDSVKFCGPTIAGLSLISASVLKLVYEKDNSKWLKALLPARSMYVMRNEMRFDYTHEILKDEESFIGGEKIKRDRRVSVMFRDQPLQTTDDPE